MTTLSNMSFRELLELKSKLRVITQALISRVKPRADELARYLMNSPTAKLVWDDVFVFENSITIISGVRMFAVGDEYTDENGTLVITEDNVDTVAVKVKLALEDNMLDMLLDTSVDIEEVARAVSTPSLPMPTDKDISNSKEQDVVTTANQYLFNMFNKSTTRH